MCNIITLSAGDVWLITDKLLNIFYLTMHSTHFIYGYMASDTWLKAILIQKKKPTATKSWATM